MGELAALGAAPIRDDEAEDDGADGHGDADRKEEADQKRLGKTR